MTAFLITMFLIIIVIGVLIALARADGATPQRVGWFYQIITNVVREALQGAESSHRLENGYEFDVVLRTENTLDIHLRMHNGPMLNDKNNTVCVDGLIFKIYPLGFNSNGITTYRLSVQW
jgi:hypothetical protein